MKKNYLALIYEYNINCGYDDCEPWEVTYYNVEELLEAGVGTCTCIAHVKLGLLILNGFLPTDHYESNNDEDYLSEDESDFMFKASGMTLEVI